MAGPLSGLKIIELAGIGPAPFAAMLLADLGADVVRLERADGAALRFGPPESELLHRGRRSVAVDLKHPDGAALVVQLAERADVLIEGFRPAVAERLGIGPEACHAVNPRLVYGRMTGWGQDGPLAHTAGHDIDYLALTGTLGALGRAGGPPQVPLNLLGDFGGGALFLTVGVLAALWEARRSGRGQVVDAAIVDGAAVLNTMLYGLMHGGFWQDQRGVNLIDTGAPFYDVYECADGAYVAVGALESKFYAEFVQLLGIADRLPEQYDVSAWPDMRREFVRVFLTKTREEWAALFAGTDACVCPVLSLLEAPQHPHLVARSTFVEHAGIRQPAPAPRFSRTPAELQLRPPRPGEHSRQALTDWGINNVEQLIATGVVTQS